MPNSGGSTGILSVRASNPMRSSRSSRPDVRRSDDSRWVKATHQPLLEPGEFLAASRSTWLQDRPHQNDVSQLVLVAAVSPLSTPWKKHLLGERELVDLRWLVADETDARLRKRHRSAHPATAGTPTRR